MRNARDSSRPASCVAKLASPTHQVTFMTTSTKRPTDIDISNLKASLPATVVNAVQDIAAYVNDAVATPRPASASNIGVVRHVLGQLVAALNATA